MVRVLLLACLGLSTMVFAQPSLRDPFHPFPTALCHPTAIESDAWRLIGVVRSEYDSLALLSHPRYGTKKVKLGERFVNQYWEIAAITLDKVEFSSLLPCPLRTTEITFVRK